MFFINSHEKRIISKTRLILKSSISVSNFKDFLKAYSLSKICKIVLEYSLKCSQLISKLCLSNKIYGFESLYTASWNVCWDWFLAVNHYNHKIWVPSILTHNLWLIFIGMKQKIFFLKKKIKMADSKKGRFSKSPILDIFFCVNLMDWSLR